MNDLRRGLAPAILACLAGCAEAPPPPPARVETKPVTPPAPPPLPARWIASGGATLIGPELAQGTLVLLGGRRALVRADGTLEAERVPAPEPLQEIVGAPTISGLRVLGRGEHGVYRFDDPLGAPVLLASSEEPLERLGAAPDAVVVWTERSELPRALDVETGSEKVLAGLPVPPARALYFADMKRGAGVFLGVGLAVSTDGGATWRAAAGGRDALTATGLRRRGGAIRAFAYAEGPDAAIDFEATKVGPSEDPGEGAGAPALLRWIRKSGRDPLEAAAAGGIDLGGGAALVASHGMLARVDLRSGAIGELVEIARGKWVPCSAARAGRAAWVACALPDTPGAEVFDPFGVLRVPLEGPRLVPDKPAVVRNSEAELRVSPSGGALLTAPCGNEETGHVCVRQPDGRWRTLTSDVELGERGTGALADGSFAFLRGLFDGDEGPEPAGGAPDDETARSRRLHVVRRGLDNKEHALAPIPFTPSRGYVKVESPIEEDADQTLRFVIDDGDGPFAVIVPPGREAPTARRIVDANEARIHAGRGVAAGEGHVLVSLDGGVTWSDVPAPRAALEAAGHAVAFEGDSTLSVSEVGVRVGPWLRLGWGSPEDSAAPAEPPALAPRVTLAPSAPPAPGPAHTLSCKSSGKGTGLPALLAGSEVRDLLGRPATKPGTKHEITVSAARISALDAVAMLDEEGPEERGKPPVSWTFRWHDPREIGGAVREAKVKAPPRAGSTSLRFAAADGGRAIFTLRSGGKLHLARVKGKAIELAEVPQDLAPGTDVVFGEGRGDPIAWLHDASVIVWLAGEKPRAVALVPAQATRRLGAPSAGSIPLLVGGSDWAVYRSLPIPPLDKAGADRAPPPASLPLDGWTRLPRAKKSLPSLPVCAARAQGARILLEGSALHTEIDGAAAHASSASYAVRIAGSEVCIESVAAAITPARQPAGGPAPSKTKPKGKQPSPAAAKGASFVRVDLVGKKGESGERGLAPTSTVKRLACGWAPAGTP